VARRALRAASSGAVKLRPHYGPPHVEHVIGGLAALVSPSRQLQCNASAEPSSPANSFVSHELRDAHARVWLIRDVAQDAPNPVNSGFAAIAQLFPIEVRNRALGYVGRQAIQRIPTSDQNTLAARVTGTHEYVAAFKRSGNRLDYACSCPFFFEHAKACKHLFALSLQCVSSELVKNAATCASFSPNGDILKSLGEELDEPDDHDELDHEHKDSFGRPLVGVRIGQRSSSWRDLAARAATHHDADEHGKIELLYFLTPGLGPNETTLAVGQRQVGAAADTFRSVERLEPDAFLYDLDRELYGLLPASLTAHQYYPPSNLRRIILTPFTAPSVLRKLAQSGRCRVVPSDLRRERDLAWFCFSRGEHVSQRRRQEPGYDFGSMLAWPLLSFEDPEEYRLLLKLIEQDKKGPKSARMFEIEPELFLDGERRSVWSVRYVHTDGTLILGSELLRCAATDTPWLIALLTQPTLGHLTEAEIPEFVERVLGRRGVSEVILPADYERVERQAPTALLELEAPGGRKLRGRVSFDYGERQIPAEQASPVMIEGCRVWERDRDAERDAFDLLRRLGFVGKLLGNSRTPNLGVAIEEKRVAIAIRELLAVGWLVRAEGKRYRSAKGFAIEVDSGIDWFEVKGSAKFDGADLPFPKLLAAIKHKQHVVDLGDGSFGVLPEEWMQRWGLVAELSAEKGDTLRFSSRQIGLAEALLSALPEDGSGARGLRALERKVSEFRSVEAVSPPQGFIGTLRPYQAQGLGFLTTLGKLGFGVCLADDMGLGKTIQVLAYLLAAHQRRGKTKPTLVVVPRSLLSNWRDEASRFTPELSIRTHWGPDRLRKKEALSAPGVVLTTYGTLRLDIALFGEVDFGCVVLDEAQAIKNKHSTTSKCAKLLSAERRIAMSGTPVENHLGELWSLFEFLNPGLLAELPALRRALESSKPSEQVLKLVRTLVRPFVLRRTKREVAKELPERVEQTLLVDLEPGERALYDELFVHYQASIAKKVAQSGVERATPHLLEALLRLRQAACHPGLIDKNRRGESSSKVDCLLERLRALREEGHRALVFSQFTSLLSIVRERLTDEQIPFEYLDGKTRDRAACVERFQSDPSIGVFLISLKAGGVGLNLTGADYVFILDPWWNPAAEAQAIDRAHRIGQTRNVIAYRLLAKGTVEERVAQLQTQKRDLVAGILGGDQALSSRLTRGDLEALLSLTSPSGLPLDAVDR